MRLAREWVNRMMTDIGRDDLVDSAELGVSELVTNALIHSAPPVAVRVRGTHAHPRIEVADRSLVPPHPTDLTDDEDDLLSTFGRGLALVALHSARWGSDIDDDGRGKTVWFEPVNQPRDEVQIEGDLFDLDALVGGRIGPGGPIETIQIHLLGMPVVAFVDLRRHYNELRRELRLLALANPERYPLAVEVSEVTLQVEMERRQSTGLERLDEAEGLGKESVDLVYTAPATAPATMARLAELLSQATVFFDTETLLSLRPTERQQQVQSWYLGEFVRQGAGEQPQPWSGGYRDARHQTAS
ncbi:MAG: ATP-binding protein [Actinomycetota bacterium]|nr:ATP-binding protein [Actinomycetota bacterium]